jgi:hypothetical protein
VADVTLLPVWDTELRIKDPAGTKPSFGDINYSDQSDAYIGTDVVSSKGQYHRVVARFDIADVVADNVRDAQILLTVKSVTDVNNDHPYVIHKGRAASDADEQSVAWARSGDGNIYGGPGTPLIAAASSDTKVIRVNQPISFSPGRPLTISALQSKHEGLTVDTVDGQTVHVNESLVFNHTSGVLVKPNVLGTFVDSVSPSGANDLYVSSVSESPSGFYVEWDGIQVSGSLESQVYYTQNGQTGYWDLQRVLNRTHYVNEPVIIWVADKAQWLSGGGDFQIEDGTGAFSDSHGLNRDAADVFFRVADNTLGDGDAIRIGYDSNSLLPGVEAASSGTITSANGSSKIPVADHVCYGWQIGKLLSPNSTAGGGSYLIREVRNETNGSHFFIVSGDMVGKEGTFTIPAQTGTEQNAAVVELIEDCALNFTGTNQQLCYFFVRLDGRQPHDEGVPIKEHPGDGYTVTYSQIPDPDRVQIYTSRISTESYHPTMNIWYNPTILPVVVLDLVPVAPAGITQVYNAPGVAIVLRKVIPPHTVTTTVARALPVVEAEMVIPTVSVSAVISRTAVAVRKDLTIGTTGRTPGAVSRTLSPQVVDEVVPSAPVTTLITRTAPVVVPEYVIGSVGVSATYTASPAPVQVDLVRPSVSVAPGPVSRTVGTIVQSVVMPGASVTATISRALAPIELELTIPTSGWSTTISRSAGAQVLSLALPSTPWSSTVSRSLGPVEAEYVVVQAEPLIGFDVPVTPVVLDLIQLPATHVADRTFSVSAFGLTEVIPAVDRTPGTASVAAPSLVQELIILQVDTTPPQTVEPPALALDLLIPSSGVTGGRYARQLGAVCLDYVPGAIVAETAGLRLFTYNYRRRRV